jgi:hypothetical protein
MKTLFAALALSFLATVSAKAADMTFPSDDPVATISVPDEWKPEETETGMQAFSPDNAISIYFDVADAKTSDKVIDDAIAFLQKNGVKITDAKPTQTDGKANGIDITAYDFDGTDADGPVSVGLAVLSPKPGKLLVVTYWGSKGDEDSHAGEVNGIIQSIKPAG